MCRCSDAMVRFTSCALSMSYGVSAGGESIRSRTSGREFWSEGSDHIVELRVLHTHGKLRLYLCEPDLRVSRPERRELDVDTADTDTPSSWAVRGVQLPRVSHWSHQRSMWAWCSQSYFCQGLNSTPKSDKTRLTKTKERYGHVHVHVCA